MEPCECLQGDEALSQEVRRVLTAATAAKAVTPFGGGPILASESDDILRREVSDVVWPIHGLGAPGLFLDGVPKRSTTNW